MDFITAHKKKSFLRKHKAIENWPSANSESSMILSQGNAWEQATTFPVSLVGPQSYLLFHNVYLADRQVILVPEQREDQTSARGQRGKQQNPAIERQECIHWEDESEWTCVGASWDPILKFPLDLLHKWIGRHWKPARTWSWTVINCGHARAPKVKILYSWGNQSRGFSFICLFNDYHAQSTQNRGWQSQALLRPRALCGKADPK